jgi:hypothetical protein
MPIDRDRPAGISSYREAKPVKKTPSGLNVARFIAREEELHQARAYTKAYAATSDRAQWEEKQNLRVGSGARVQQHKQCVLLFLFVFPGFEPSSFTVCCSLCTLRLLEEMDLMNKEVQIVRAERLKAYYDACYTQWEDELRARGLALVRHRD